MAMHTFENQSGSIWVNGEWVPWAEAKLHVLSFGFQYANTVWEGVRVYKRQPLFLEDHSRRLLDSAKLIGISVPYTASQLDEVMLEICDRQELDLGYIRPVVWLGAENIAIAQNNSINVAVTGWSWGNVFDRNALLNGISLHVSRWARPQPNTMPCQAKSSAAYLIGTMAKQEANQNNCDDALMLAHDGSVAEASAANLFFVKNGTLFTPPPSCFLNGITRQAILILASQHGIEVVEKKFDLEELIQADEVFLTGTAYEVQPINRINDVHFTGRELTEKVMSIYSEITMSEHVPRALQQLI